MQSAEHRPATVMDSEALRVAGDYAEAMMDLCPGIEQARQVEAELDALLNQLAETPELHALLGASLLSRRQKRDVARRVFAGRVSHTVEGLLDVMARRDRLRLLGGVHHAFRELLDAREGRTPVTVTLARAPSPEQRGAIASMLRDALGGEVVLTVRVDEGLIGGMVARVGDTRIDASVRGRLRALTATAADAARGGQPR